MYLTHYIDMPQPAFSPIELCGAVHLHTRYSDGNVSMSELIEAALEAGLDYIVVTDHMTLRCIQEGYLGFQGPLFVEVGYEHNDLHNRNHYLALGTNTMAPPDASPQQYIDYIRENGGKGFLAHPLEQRHYFRNFPPYPWNAWNVRGFDGIELWNQMSDWIENLKSVAGMVRVFFPRRFMSDPPPELLRRWDQYNRLRFVSGIGGVDAHTRRYGLGLISLRIFSIRVELRGIRTHLYLAEPLPRHDPEIARSMLIHALAGGHGFIANYRRGDARGARFWIETAEGKIDGPGNPLRAILPPARLRVSLPVVGEIRCIRNGEAIATATGVTAAFEIAQKGVYRLEVRVRGKAWIYTNPFPVGEYPL